MSENSATDPSAAAGNMAPDYQQLLTQQTTEGQNLLAQYDTVRPDFRAGVGYEAQAQAMRESSEDLLEATGTRLDNGRVLQFYGTHEDVERRASDPSADLVIAVAVADRALAIGYDPAADKATLQQATADMVRDYQSRFTNTEAERTDAYFAERTVSEMLIESAARQLAYVHEVPLASPETITTTELQTIEEATKITFGEQAIQTVEPPASGNFVGGRVRGPDQLPPGVRFAGFDSDGQAYGYDAQARLVVGKRIEKTYP